MRVKVSLKDLEKAIAAIKKESFDLDVGVEVEMDILKIVCTDKSSRTVLITLFSTQNGTLPKITKTETL